MNIKIFSLLLIPFFSYAIPSKEEFLLYANEICTYNGVPSYISINNTIQCECQNGYESLEDAMTLLGVKIQCSYMKKRRSLALFFSLFLPFGFDYFYLEKYNWFCVIFLLDIIFIVNEAICFFYVNKFKSEKSSREKNNEQNENNTLSKEEHSKDCGLIYQAINFLFIGIWVILWIVNVVLMAAGKILDAKGIETEDDLKYLFKVKKD